MIKDDVHLDRLCYSAVESPFDSGLKNIRSSVLEGLNYSQPSTYKAWLIMDSLRNPQGSGLGRLAGWSSSADFSQIRVSLDRLFLIPNVVFIPESNKKESVPPLGSSPSALRPCDCQ